MDDSVISRRKASVLATNKVLRNTYLLLGLSLLFSAGTAIFSVASNAPYPGLIITIIGIYGLMFLTSALKNSPWGVAAVFLFTGFMGYTLGPLLNYYIHNFSNGGELIATALGATGIIFFALSGYAITTKKDFSYLAGFIFVATITVLLALVAGIFFQIPALYLAISAAFVLISSAMILFQTSMIIQGGERNYIMATVSLYVALYNLFVSLLQIFAAFAGNRD